MSDGVAPFRTRTAIALLAAGSGVLLLFLVMLAYLPQPTPNGDARGHALSVAGNGFAGLVALTDATGSHSLIVRSEADLGTRALLVVTPEPTMDGDALRTLLARRHGAPTLIVLPKWRTTPMRGRPGWSSRIGRLDPAIAAAPIAALAPGAVVEGTPFARLSPPVAPDLPRLARVRVGPLAAQQRLAGAGLVPLLADRDGRTVLARVPHRPVYVLAEPDLLDNAGLADRWTARQGWRMVDDLMTTNELAFDVTLNGLARKRSPLRAMFDPPFVAVTACLLLAGLLAGLHGAVRFGAPLAVAPALPAGKRQLVDNTARLFRAARKEHRLGAAYAALTLDRARREANAPARLEGDVLADWLDRDTEGPGFADLAAAADAATDREALLRAARRLHDWKRNRTA